MQQRLGKYELLERIGQGGQGTVYRARDTELDRIVAIKRFLTYFPINPTKLERNRSLDVLYETPGFANAVD